MPSFNRLSGGLVGFRYFSSQLSEVFTERFHSLGIIRLNRTKALNALNLPMVTDLLHLYRAWTLDPTIRCILIKGEGDKAFCAGGDVRTLCEEFRRSDNQDEHGHGKPGLITADFFRQEYKMNYALAKLPKPHIAIWDGIVMGGGVGISIHGKFRIATERTLFSMPETGIGLFPDVGGMYWIPRLEGGLGPYIGLTGCKLNAADLIDTGIATHFIPHASIPLLETALKERLDTDDFKESEVEQLLAHFHESKPTNGTLKEHRDAIDHCFMNKNSMEEILASLMSMETDWSKKTIETLLKMSPTSLKVTLRGLNEGKHLPIEDTFKLEYRMSQGFMLNGSDFYEGIRALLIDKDKNPCWNPSNLDDVDETIVNRYFQNLGENEWSPF